MGILTEGDERPEDGLRKKLLEKDRENDKASIFQVLLWFLSGAEPQFVVAACADSDVAGSALPETICGGRPGAAARV